MVAIGDSDCSSPMPRWVSIYLGIRAIQHPNVGGIQGRSRVEDEFGDAVSLAEAVIVMQNRRKRSNETAREYIQVMRNLGGQVDMAEKDVIRFIAEDLTSDVLTIQEL